MPPWVNAVNFTLFGFVFAVIFLCIYLEDTHKDSKGAACVFIFGSIFAWAFTELLL